MRDRSNPGPPLTPAEEYCACQPPSTGEYLKALAASLLFSLAAAGAWLLVTLVMQQISGLTSVLIGLAAGWTVHRAAGRHSSTALGVVAATASILASLVGFALLWLPALARVPLTRRLTWYELLLIGLGALVAYRQAAPRGRGKGFL